MKRRVARAIAAGPAIEVVLLPGAARLVTLADPAQGVEDARGAFVRIDPPANQAPEETAAWRQRAAAVALAVRVLPSRRDEGVPAEDARPAEDRGADVRREALEIARARGGEELAAEVERLFG